MIAAALVGAPPLDRDSMGADLHPFNCVASSDPVIAVIDRLVRTRLTANPWIAAHRGLLGTDQNGEGYAAFVDGFRDVAFQVGVDYALRAFSGPVPDWWHSYQGLDDRTKAAVGAVIRFAANGGVR